MRQAHVSDALFAALDDEQHGTVAVAPFVVFLALSARGTIADRFGRVFIAFGLTFLIS